MLCLFGVIHFPYFREDWFEENNLFPFWPEVWNIFVFCLVLMGSGDGGKGVRPFDRWKQCQNLSSN